MKAKGSGHAAQKVDADGHGCYQEWTFPSPPPPLPIARTGNTDVERAAFEWRGRDV